MWVFVGLFSDKMKPYTIVRREDAKYLSFFVITRAGHFTEAITTIIIIADDTTIDTTTEFGTKLFYKNTIVRIDHSVCHLVVCNSNSSIWTIFLYEYFKENLTQSEAFCANKSALWGSQTPKRKVYYKYE